MPVIPSTSSSKEHMVEQRNVLSSVFQHRVTFLLRKRISSSALLSFRNNISQRSTTRVNGQVKVAAVHLVWETGACGRVINFTLRRPSKPPGCHCSGPQGDMEARWPQPGWAKRLHTIARGRREQRRRGGSRADPTRSPSRLKKRGRGDAHHSRCRARQACDDRPVFAQIRL